MRGNRIITKIAVLLGRGQGRRPYCVAAISVLSIVEITGLVLMTEQSARAYVDPGSGFLAFQMVGASLAGAAFVFRRKLRRLLGRDREKLQPEPATQVITQPASSGESKNGIVS